MDTSMNSTLFAGVVSEPSTEQENDETPVTKEPTDKVTEAQVTDSSSPNISQNPVTEQSPEVTQIPVTDKSATPVSETPATNLTESSTPKISLVQKGDESSAQTETPTLNVTQINIKDAVKKDAEKLTQKPVQNVTKT